MNNLQRKKEQQAQALLQQGSLEAAETIYRTLVQEGISNHAIFCNLAAIHGMRGQHQEMIGFYRQALAINPNLPEALFNIACVLREQGDPQGAIDHCHRALAINPKSPDTLMNLGNAQWDQGNLQAAVDAYRNALAIRPDFPDALANLGAALWGQGDMEAAVSCYRKAIAIDANHAEAHRNLSMALLQSGDYGTGWAESEWRFQVKDKLHAHPGLERWTGSNNAPGEPLIIVSEQGLGDTLQFMRYVAHLDNAGLPVALCAQPKLHGLIRASGITKVIYSPEETNQLTVGKWLPLLSLPGLLKVSASNPVVTEPYIKVPQEKIVQWQQKLAAEPRPIVGINWQGSPKGFGAETTAWRDGQDNLLPRSVKDWRQLNLDKFDTITEKTTATLLSLQKGFGSEQLSGCSFLKRFVSCQEEINQTWDFVETAAIIANCDLVVTSDTSVAHLAAGMGKITWLLLTKVCEWRWGVEGETTFWYPSMRLFRQRERGDWYDVMERVAAALQ